MIFYLDLSSCLCRNGQVGRYFDFLLQSKAFQENIGLAWTFEAKMGKKV